MKRKLLSVAWWCHVRIYRFERWLYRKLSALNARASEEKW